MYTTKNTHCSNFVCEIRVKCKRMELNEENINTTSFCFAYSKKRKHCNHFIQKS